jgi:uncharacterized hydrophobic protein (TIGR00341 family)
MALRLIEIFLPDGDPARWQERLATDKVIGCWTQPLANDRVLMRVLLRVEDTEAFLDGLQTWFAGTDFRAVLLPVEASVPRLEPEKEAPKVTPTESAKQEVPPSPRISRDELYQQVSEGIQLNRTFVVLVALSAVVAAVGIVYDNVTVVIGAMVIAPMLGPNVALALATTLGDTSLARSAVKANIVGILVALAVAIPLGLLLPVDPQVGQIQSRLHAQIKDIVLALASGSAGVLSITTVAPAALIGVMVAVALIPPLITFGLLLGASRPDLAFDALLLFITNVICINLAGVLTLLLQNVRPRTWWEADKAKRAIRIAIPLWAFLLLALAAVIAVLQSRS